MNRELALHYERQFKRGLDASSLTSYSVQAEDTVREHGQQKIKRRTSIIGITGITGAHNSQNFTGACNLTHSGGQVQPRLQPNTLDRDFAPAVEALFFRIDLRIGKVYQSE